MTLDKNPKGFVPALRFHGLTKLYDALMKTTMPENAFKMALIQQATIQPNFKVLDFGCGTGTLTKLTAEINPNSSITGVDVDQSILKIANNKIGAALQNLQLDHYDGMKLPYKDNSYDRVITSLVFHHLNKAQKEMALKEIFRVLKHNGEFHIADWGKAANVLMRLLYYPVQILDGFKTTTDNVLGLIPNYIRHSGFSEVIITESYNTIFGTLSLFMAKKRQT